MNLEEFGPDAKDEMSPADYIQYCLDQYYEYRTLAMDPTINDQATKLYLDKASEYYARAQEAMDEIEPDNTDHLSDEDKALPNKSLADQEAEMNESDNNTEIFTNQHGEKMTMVYNPETGNIKIQHDDIDKKFYPLMQFVDRFTLNKEEKAALLAFYKSKHKMDEAEDDKLSDEDQAIIDKYEEEEANREISKIDADMYRESKNNNKMNEIDLKRWTKLAGINEGMDATSLMGKYITLSQNVGMSGYHPKTAQEVIDIMPKFQTPGFGIKVHDTDPGRASFGNAVYLVQQDGSLKMVSNNYDTSG